MAFKYTDFGPKYVSQKKHGKNVLNPRYVNRPYCDLCGGFRGCYLRKTGRVEHGQQIWRCRKCDEEYD